MRSYLASEPKLEEGKTGLNDLRNFTRDPWASLVANVGRMNTKEL